jgi:hypothetical protein
MLVAVVGVCAGCSSTGGTDGWVTASPEVQALGVYTWRALEASQADGASQRLLLGDRQAIQIGQLTLSDGDSHTVALELSGHAWSEQLRPNDGVVALALDDRQATLTLSAAGLTGDAAAQALYADSQPYLKLVQALGADAKLAAPGPLPGTAPPTAAPATGAPTAATPSVPGAPSVPPALPDGGLALCCSEVAVAGTGWAWYWEAKPAVAACRRAGESANVACEASSFGEPCCQLPATCINCIDWGTGTYCTTAGYLQISCR